MVKQTRPSTREPAQPTRYPGGYRRCALAAPSRGKAKQPRIDDPADHLVLLDADRHFAVARGERIALHAFDALDETRPAPPVDEVALPQAVAQLQPHAAAGPLALVAALADGSLWSVTFDDAAARDGKCDREPVRPLTDPLGARVRWLIPTPRSFLAIVDDAAGGLPELVQVDASSGRILRRAPLPFARLTTVHPLDAKHGDLLVAIDATHGAHLVGFPGDSDATAPVVTRLDPETRITAAAAVDSHWLVVARKGGELVKVRHDPARADRGMAAGEVCRRIREVLRACGCDCKGHGHDDDTGHDDTDNPCDPRPQDPGGPRDPRDPKDPKHPHDPRAPGRPPHDDEPCERKQRGAVGWSIARLQRVGAYLVAMSARGNRMAVFDQRLDLLFERYLGTRGALLAAGTGTDRLLMQPRGAARLEAWALHDYADGLARQPRAPVPNIKAPSVPPGTVTFHGRRSQPAVPNPHLKIAVFTVTEPGQVFSDADQSRMHAQLLDNVYGVARDYYRENSFDTLETVFSVFGVDIAGPSKPLVLPRAMSSYFHDDYFAGGVEAVMPGDWAAPTVLDGTETLTLRTDPSSGTGRDYVVPFAALWTQRAHNAFPVEVAFAGGETLQLDVTDQAGVARTLNLTFGPFSASMAQGDDEAAFLASLGQHVTAAIRAAESAAGAPVTVQDVVFRRVRTSSNDAEFGNLLGQFRIAAAGAPAGKGRIDIVPPGGAVPAPLAALGLGGAGATARTGVLGSRLQIVNYFRHCLDAARRDVNEGVGLNDTHLADSLTADEDATAQLVTARVLLNNERGGAGASISVVSHGGLAGTGWDAAGPVPGSASNSNNRNTMRDHVDLANDVFTAAMDHIRATGAWDAEAVRAQFADFDAMMIGFVGACPASVPAADRWNCANANDFGRLRMFVRYHQATDLHNPDASQAPVTMGTSLLIGQRFNQFDPGVMSHEIGHGLGLPDLYSASGFRDDVAYVDRWCQMAGGNSRFNHFCAWAKWAVGWIPESADPAQNRVVDVPMPAPAGTTTTEAWLVPVERWDNAMRADVIAEVGDSLPIAQMMKVHLGSDGGVIDIIELRAPGASYSQQLPPTPAVIVTNVLDPGTDRRWAVNGLYRRSVHLLNQGNELTADGDTWDFAAGREFPLKGCKAEIVDLRTIRGGAVPICRLRVTREAAEFIDLYFQDNVPSWRSPDIWVDWPGDNPDPAVPRVYPEGTPTDQGETVLFPGSGVEPHFLVVRPHNAGNVHAENVKLRWFICDPPGAGDDGRWVERDTRTMPQLDGGDWDVMPFTWDVGPGTSEHQCLRAEIIDWTIPSEVDPATGDTVALGSDDVILQNNNAQKNVFDFEALT